MIGIGVLGYHIRSRHGLEMYVRNYPGATIRAVAQDPAASPALLEGHGGPEEVRAYAARMGAEYCPDYRAILAREDIQLISLMCEPAHAPQLVAEIAAAGKHILSDKPLAGNAADSERIAAAVRRYGVQMLVGFSTRYAPPLRRVYDRIRAGEIGELLALHCTYCFGGKLADFTATPAFTANFGGGDMTIAGCYAVDCLRWLTGREPTRVFARTGSFFFPDYQGVMEDLGQVSLTFGGDIPATILSGRLAAPGRVFDLDITGTRGSVQVSAESDTITVQGQTRRSEAYGAPAPERMVHDFLRCLEHGEPSPIPPEEGVACARVLEAAYRSARIGEAVALS